MTHNIQSSSALATRRCGALFSALLLAGAVLFGLAAGLQRCAAGTGFPNTATNGQTFSIGVFQVVVDPSFAFLFGPSNSSSYYPGYAGTNSGILTGPVMFDGNTMIGESASHVRPATTFPIAVGTPNQYPPSSTYSNILGYTDFALIPPLWTSAPAGVDEIFTEIEEMNLQGYSASSSNGLICSDSRVPTVTSHTLGQLVTVKAGPGPFGIGPTLPLNRRSIGIVQQITNGAASDFAAQSFFDIYIELNLPQVPGTVANYEFPASGAVLYNDVADPLLIENLSLTNLPPEATYVHGQTTAVPIRFKTANPPFWNAGDVLGYLTLAGHGVFTNPVTASQPCVAATTTGGLLDQTLGPVGSPIPPPPIPWLRPDNLYPPTNSGFASVVNTVVDNGVTNVLDDTVSFLLPGNLTIYFRDLDLEGLTGSIPTPPLNASASYNAPNTQLALEISLDGTTWFPSTGFGPIMAKITNTSAAGDSTATFDTEMLEMNLFVESPLVPMMLRESPSKASLGRHTLRSDPRGFRVSSFFDVFLELSTDGGGTWYPASRAMRLLSSLPPAAPASIFVKHIANSAVMEWQNSFTLQSTPDLRLPFTDVAGPVTTGPYTNATAGGAMFFRLRN